MAPLEAHELASLANSSIPSGSHNNGDERISDYVAHQSSGYEEGSDHGDEDANVALLSGHSRPSSGSGSGTDAVSQPKRASQVIKTIITEVRVYSNNLRAPFYAERRDVWSPRQLPRCSLQFSA